MNDQQEGSEQGWEGHPSGLRNGASGGKPVARLCHRPPKAKLKGNEGFEEPSAAVIKDPLQQLVVHAVPYRHRAQYSVTFHLGGLTASEKQIVSVLKVGNWQEQERDNQIEEDIASIEGNRGRQSEAYLGQVAKKCTTERGTRQLGQR